MADKNISALPSAQSIDIDSLFVAEQQGDAVKVTGGQIVQYARDSVDADVTAAVNAANAAQNSAQEAKSARDAIADMEVEANTLAFGSPATVDKTDLGGTFLLTFGLPAGGKGDKGDPFRYEDFTQEQLDSLKGAPGKGLTILDYYPTLNDLQTAVTSPSAGDAYGVGTAQPYDIYIYSDTSGWVNNGQLQGADGEDGISVTHQWNGTVLEVTSASGTSSADLKGQDGTNGITPEIGANGNWWIGNTDTGILAKAQTKTDIVAVTLAASDWDSSDNTQTVECIGVLADETAQVITPVPAVDDQDEYYSAGVLCTGFAANSLTFTADEIPTADILVYVALEQTGDAPLEIYSTEETVVGTWIDGKPIYRQIMSGICPATTADGTFKAATYSIGCEVDHLVAMHGWVINNLSNPEHIPFPYITNSGGGFAKCGMTTVSGYSKAWVGTNLVVAKTFPWYLCIEYTKTTDTPTNPVATAMELALAYEEGVNE